MELVKNIFKSLLFIIKVVIIFIIAFILGIILEALFM